MNRQRALALVAVVVALGAVVAAAAVPGAVTDPRDERPGRVGVADVTLRPTNVGGATVDLSVGVALQHYGNPTENVSVRVRAIDSTTGFLVAEARVPVGTMTGEGRAEANASISVEREGGYRIEVAAFRGDELTDQARATVEGLGALTPAYAQTNVSFVDEPALPALSSSVVEAGDDETRLRISAALTNRGDEPSESLELSLVLRQADSNLVAARERVQVSAIRPGRTATVDATVAVPAEYNYYVDAVLWSDGVLIDSTRSAVNLAPERTISVDERRERVNISVGDFEREDGRPVDRPEATETSSSSAPGFTAGLAVVAVLFSAIAARRRIR